MKVTRNSDGTVTVTVPKAPEQYDNGLVIAETLPADEFDRIVAGKPAPPADGPVADPEQVRVSAEATKSAAADEYSRRKAAARALGAPVPDAPGILDPAVAEAPKPRQASPRKAPRRARAATPEPVAPAKPEE